MRDGVMREVLLLCLCRVAAAWAHNGGVAAHGRKVRRCLTFSK